MITIHVATATWLIPGEVDAGMNILLMGQENNVLRSQERNGYRLQINLTLPFF